MKNPKPEPKMIQINIPPHPTCDCGLTMVQQGYYVRGKGLVHQCPDCGSVSYR